MAVYQSRTRDAGGLSHGLPERRYRPELHGVRGLALLGVVLFHLFGAGRVSGGIDIFLAVSGFLFTGMLLRETAASGGTINIPRYLGRLVRRILVPAAIVVIITLVAGLAILPPTRHIQLWREARASLLYFENIELISSQLAYGAAGPETSPFQHFWSLSVQGQFYMVWPVIAIVAVLLARALRVPAAWAMASLVSIIFLASFAHAIYVGGYNQDAAYLMSTTRAWELAFGGLLALAIGAIRLPKQLRAPAGWVGIALLVSSGFVLDGAQLFPGGWALWPLLGLTLILISASPEAMDHEPASSPARLLSNRPLAWIGDHAYGLYLWHWPLLIFYMEVRNREAVGVRGASFILALTAVLAMLMYRFIERPLKNRQTRRGAAASHKANKFVVAGTAAALAFAGTGTALVVKEAEHQDPGPLRDWARDRYPGAMALADDASDIPILDDYWPDPEVLASMRPDYYSWGCRQQPGDNPGSDEITVCEDPEAPETPHATVVIAGGSHAGQWHHAWRALARRYGWELLITDKSGCVFGELTDVDSDMCQSWQVNFVDWLRRNEVDLVVTPGTRMLRSAESEKIQAGAPDRWNEIVGAGAELLLIRGTPRPDENTADCLASGKSATECGANSAQMLPENPLDNLNLSESVHILDLSPYICPEDVIQTAGRCPAIIGNVAVWYDNSHLSNPYVESLSPLLESYLLGELPELFP